MRDRHHGGSPPGHRPQGARAAGTGPARVGRPHGENAAQDARRLRRLPRAHPREPRRARGINRWRARCLERCTPGSEGGCPEKAQGQSRNTGPRRAADPTITWPRRPGWRCGWSTPATSSTCPGRGKSDRLDCVWLCKLNERGMLRRSFVPPEPRPGPAGADPDPGPAGPGPGPAPEPGREDPGGRPVD